MRAVVCGPIATLPVGGVAWDYGQYAVGLERLGFEVYYLEDTAHPPLHPTQWLYVDDPGPNLAHLQRELAVMSPTLAERWHFRMPDGRSYGMDRDEVLDLVAEADLFLNVSGICVLRDAYLPSPCKVLIDTDPGWNHFVMFDRSEVGPGLEDAHGFRAHDRFFTYAERIGEPGCALPTLGVEWHPTRPPVVLDAWPWAEPGERWTTVLSWDNYRRPIEHDGRRYGSKEREFSRIAELPQRTTATLEIAAGGVEPPVDRWRELGWSVVDAPSVTATAEAYRDYVRGSRGELSVAKNVYVATGSGWFSCRSACYLAAGLPVVLQDTGWSSVLPNGEGLLRFEDLDGALAALTRVERDPERHRKAAREVAAEYLSSDVVLAQLLERVPLGGRRGRT